ncbi:23S rRNA (pseudouridine(1915)-N(3))-methyltransferase RlmH [[Mycoplasma] mobile]|uniref:Ribosomal RNA large subunit methyltransferase H n=1 Tax=Mycoplasma mobile (strain ATCC 43663 / 163K / NCTC 11711) TaxID=267748 RepID=RLMH_MYCM1|nr:23S rRNA (pseudouridine(1915)-N(3))-methyltransferase RlmH [[Mycoplasma] mobile]Q6KID5.1 RecName: Full=Ribosomal RNA large subunit methyltransferase H; AltName: Full=23S rRNA (pseudouridine1915-N3)-methyltransferase; AltName: Full=23S rRNA m3Psi1915 methyltransferase; AltName: Full=rRNA (pseudouridine-N3-)-methyltransferase RlmH [Mycoplasma mobile 163K]AAT27641.1 expressed protein [Mycoplasma mobile 163K]
MKINLIAVGKLEKEYLNLYLSYLKKISFFATINLIEIKEINEKNIDLKKQKETELIIEKIPKNSKVYLCSLQGQEKTSEDFSLLFNEDNLTFVIGGSNGVDESTFLHKISFSKNTFPHQLFRILLVEQIYRSFTILKGIKYHK